MYDTIYQERYMGLPQDNAEGYRLGSPINFAEGLSGDLLIVHGSGDDNVHYQGTERLVNRLIELGKPFDAMVYPNRSHSISEGKGTTPLGAFPAPYAGFTRPRHLRCGTGLADSFRLRTSRNR